jgi:hypothetical protein
LNWFGANAEIDVLELVEDDGLAGLTEDNGHGELAEDDGHAGLSEAGHAGLVENVHAGLVESGHVGLCSRARRSNETDRCEGVLRGDSSFTRQLSTSPVAPGCAIDDDSKGLTARDRFNLESGQRHVKYKVF